MIADDENMCLYILDRLGRGKRRLVGLASQFPLCGPIFATWRPNEVGIEERARHSACPVLGRLRELEMRKCSLMVLAATAIGLVANHAIGS